MIDIQEIADKMQPRVLAWMAASSYDGAPFTADTTGTNDSTAAINAIIAAAGSGAKISLRKGTYRVDGTLLIANDNVHVQLENGASIVRTNYNNDGILITGNEVRIEGGEIVSPAHWDCSNPIPIGQDYCVIRVLGNNGTHAAGNKVSIVGVTLTNVNRIGIYSQDADDLSILGCRISGNFPAGSYTDTAHFGIWIDPSDSGVSGHVVIGNNFIKSCVQGIFCGNMSGGVGQGVAVNGNSFDGCHNHAVYVGVGFAACAVSGNTFIRCSAPIAMTGPGHAVTGNTIYTDTTGNNTDIVGISMRQAIGCVVSSNTIFGDAGTGSSVIVLDTLSTSASTEISRNSVIGNTIILPSGTSHAIRIGSSGYTTILNDNVVCENIIRGNGVANAGLILLAPKASGSTSFGNKINNNNIVVTGQSHAIIALSTSHLTIQNNSIRFEVNVATTLGAIVLNSVDRCTISNNDIHNPATFGTGLALRGYWEQAGTTATRLIGNYYHGDLTLLSSFTPIILIANSDAFIDERGVGTPSGVYYGAPGSRWSRSDGGAGTSLYVKETPNTSLVWRAV
jgi:hypothetical protein